MGGFCTGIMAKPGSQHFAGSQHHLHPRDRLQAIAIRGMPKPTLHNVPDQTGVWPGPGAITPKRHVLLRQIRRKLLLRHPRLDHRITQFPIHFMNAVHASQIHNHLSIQHWTGIAITPILPGADRIQRCPILTRSTHDPHDLIAGTGLQHGQRPATTVRTGAGIANQISVRYENVRLTQQSAPRRHSGIRIQ